MISNREEVESKRIATFYVMFMIFQFPTLIFAIYNSGGFYKVGKYSSHLLLLFIAFMELVKYFISVIYLRKRDLNITRMHEDVDVLSFFRFFLSRSKLKEGFKTVCTVLLMTLVYFTISVLYGAELFEKYEETLMFSSLLSLLTIFPICINLGSHSMIPLITGFRPVDKLQYLLFQNVYLTCLGAWLGAFVIPLDWDRPWQEWPIPCSIGALFGYQLSHILIVFHNSITLVKKKINHGKLL